MRLESNSKTPPLQWSVGDPFKARETIHVPFYRLPQIHVRNKAWTGEEQGGSRGVVAGAKKQSMEWTWTWREGKTARISLSVEEIALKRAFFVWHGESLVWSSFGVLHTFHFQSIFGGQLQQFVCGLVVA